MDQLLDALPPDLRAKSPIISRIAAGMSGAGVFRVEAGESVHVLKQTGADEPLAKWREQVEIQRGAAAVGVAPRVVHVDEERRAILTDFLEGAPFRTLYYDPAGRDRAITLLADALRAVHAIPIPAAAQPADARAFLQMLWGAVSPTGPLPAFVADAVHATLAMDVPSSDRPLVMSHNDANPSNFVFDGTRLFLLDWQTAAPNDPYYDLAAVALFLRMDVAHATRLVAAYLGAPVADLPARFVHDRRLVAHLSGTASLNVARRGGYAGTVDVTLDDAPSLADIYLGMRDGTFTLASGEGQWRFGLALIREGVAGLAP